MVGGEVVSTMNEGGRSVYRAKVRYEYAVSGRPFTGKRIFFGDTGWFKKATASDRVERYKVGNPVEVCYDPKLPARSVLERDIHPELWNSLATAAVVTLAVVWLVTSAKWVA